MKYKAPDHVTTIELTIGLVEVVDGEVDVPNELSLSDITGLIANGFVPIEQRAVEATESVTAKSKTTAKPVSDTSTDNG